MISQSFKFRKGEIFSSAMIDTVHTRTHTHTHTHNLIWETKEQIGLRVTEKETNFIVLNFQFLGMPPPLEWNQNCRKTIHI